MAYEALEKSLENQVEQEKEKILEAARKKAVEIKEMAARKVEKLNQLKETDLEKKKAVDRNGAPAKKSLARIPKGVLKVRYEVLEDTFQKVKSELGQFRKKSAYPEILARLIVEAIEDCRACEWVAVSPDDQKIAQEIVKKRHLQVKVTAEKKLNNGVIAYAHGGKVRVDNTLESRFDRVLPLIITEVGKILYGTGKA